MLITRSLRFVNGQTDIAEVAQSMIDPRWRAEESRITDQRSLSESDQ